MFSVFFSRRAGKDIKRLDKRITNRCLEKIKLLSTNPIPKHVVKLKGSENIYRIRIGKYRILYSVYFERKIIIIVKIGKRESIYMRLQ